MGEVGHHLRVLVVVGLLLSLSTSIGCFFGKSRFRGVVSYRDGKVYLQYGDFYRVGKLPQRWRSFHSGAQAIAFYHRDYGATIFTDAFCREQFEDAPLEMAIGRMVSGLEGLTPHESKTIELDGREALWKRYSGRLDGHVVAVEAVAVKKNHCLFDFVAVSPSTNREEVATDFTVFYSDFTYHPKD